MWLKIPWQQAAYIPIAVRHQFEFHHATSAQEFIFIRELVGGSREHISDYATHTVGIGALVIDGQNNILVVKERYYPERGYIIPTGGVKRGEHIWQAAMREVKEETGIDTEFLGIIGWREALDRNDIVDVCFACVLKPLSHEIVKDDFELTDACWMPYNTFKNIAQRWSAEFLTAYETHGATINYRLGESSAFTTFYGEYVVYLKTR